MEQRKRYVHNPALVGQGAAGAGDEAVSGHLVIVWIRGTFPRLRIDQLMAFAWKVVVPLSFLTVVMTAVCQFYGWPAWSLTLMSLTGLVWVAYAIYRRMAGPASRVAQVRARQEALMAARRQQRAQTASSEPVQETGD